MKKTLLIAIISLMAMQMIGQNSLNGGYISLAAFINNQPQYSDSFNISKRSISDIQTTGGNDYKILSANKSIKKSVIKKEIWGIFQNDTLYLNGIFVTGLYWFAKVEILGRYSFLRPSFPANQRIQNSLGLNDPMLNMFGAVGGAQMALKRIPLIYDMKTGEKMLLTWHNIAKLLNKYDDLKNQFGKDPNNMSEAVLLKYLQKINEIEN